MSEASKFNGIIHLAGQVADDDKADITGQTQQVLAQVDRLLASPEWGEQRAHYWLDAARYGDTHGIHFDNYREMWTYREWVINAFNRDLPYDRFIEQQLAADRLPE